MARPVTLVAGADGSQEDREMAQEVPASLVAGADGRPRCWWCAGDEQYVAYHDLEWGQPVHDEHRLFEKLVLEGFQAGLSWLTILHRRERLREAFAGFDPERLAAFDDADVRRLLGDDRLIRNRAKVEAAVANARCYLRLREQGERLAALVWAHAPATRPRPAHRSEVPATTPQSTALARDLKQRGWRFVGPTTAYAFMQSMGLVDDHIEGCHVTRSAHHGTFGGPSGTSPNR
jgi:DNA-3-methyladenine glycosylase I